MAKEINEAERSYLLLDFFHGGDSHLRNEWMVRLGTGLSLRHVDSSRFRFDFVATEKGK